MKNFEILTYFSDVNDGNVAYHVGLSLDEAQINRKSLANKLHFDVNNLVYMQQSHSDHVKVVDYDTPKCVADCDAIITQQKKLPLMVMVADCIPIIVSDAQKGVIAVVHSGRNGTFKSILEKTIVKMIDVFDCNVSDIEVIFGPHIGFCCYEVSQEMADIVTQSFGKEFEYNRKIDLLGINLQLLQKLGVNPQNITVHHICTACDKSANYFSYRKDKNCGRFCAIAMIQ